MAFYSARRISAFPNYPTVQLQPRTINVSVPPSCLTCSSLSLHFTWGETAGHRHCSVPPLRQLPLTQCKRARVFFLFLQHDWLPQVTERIKPLITSKHKTSGSLAANRADIYIFFFFKSTVTNLKTEHQWDKQRPQHKHSLRCSSSSKQFCPQQEQTTPMRTFSSHFCSFSATIKLQDRAICAGSSPKKWISYKTAAG